MGASTVLNRSKLLMPNCLGQELTTSKMVGTSGPTTSSFYTYPVQFNKFTTTVPLAKVPRSVKKILTSSVSNSAKFRGPEARILNYDNYISSNHWSFLREDTTFLTISEYLFSSSCLSSAHSLTSGISTTFLYFSKLWICSFSILSKDHCHLLKSSSKPINVPYLMPTTHG